MIGKLGEGLVVAVELGADGSDFGLDVLDVANDAIKHVTNVVDVVFEVGDLGVQLVAHFMQPAINEAIKLDELTVENFIELSFSHSIFSMRSRQEKIKVLACGGGIPAVVSS
ncbi:hypothetical protein ACG83_00125 [Frankia sp. R43]|nr:hypothetical protein ACG83_00125 [Frankia sp. R43]